MRLRELWRLPVGQQAAIQLGANLADRNARLIE
jgi:hypothetical protein